MVSVLLFWLLVEPAINRALAIEDAVVSEAHEHGHGATSGSAHHAGEVVTRFQQQVGGTLTIIVVAVLFGLAFSVVYAKSEHRMVGTTELGRSLCLAVLVLGAAVLMPALIVPANPPGVGDPDTVNQRTLAYLLAILVSLLAIGLVFAVQKALDVRNVPTEWRWLLTALGTAVAAAVLLLAIPRVDQDIPAAVPAALIWDFRIGSLAQLAGMWVTIGIVHGFRSYRLSRNGSVPVARQRLPA